MVCSPKLLSVIVFAVASCGASVAKSTESAVTRLRLSSSDGSPLEMISGIGDEEGFQLSCHGQVVVETAGYFARADKLTFISAKNVLILESHKGAVQLISHRDKQGQEASFAAKMIRLELSTGTVATYGVESIEHAQTPAAGN